eukprot:36556-Eustigmatos_ZCMA.PRE.1
MGLAYHSYTAVLAGSTEITAPVFRGWHIERKDSLQSSRLPLTEQCEVTYPHLRTQSRNAAYRLVKEPHTV